MNICQIVNFEMIASNYPVLKRLSTPFRYYMYSQLDTALAEELQEFLELDSDIDPINDFLPTFEEE